jgi:hypothetical protein
LYLKETKLYFGTGGIVLWWGVNDLKGGS